MSFSALVRWGGLAATVAGVLLVISAVIALGQSGEPSEIATTSAYAFNSVLEIIAVVLLTLGLVGLYARQSEVAGLLGLVGFLVAFAGTILLAGFFWSSAFIAPALANAAPALLNAGPPPGLLPTFSIFAIGWVLFGVASLRTRIYPRLAVIVLIIGAVLTFLPIPLVGVVFSVAVAWLGFSVFTGRGVPAPEQPSRAP
jgi:hypothetical protein